VSQVGWFIAAIIYMAILYVLVRPGSNGPTIIKDLSSALSDLVKGTVGYTYSNNSWEAPS
jgi:hypothetical protein